MMKSLWQRWIHRLKSMVRKPWSHAGSKLRNRLQLQVETLEDRWAPALIISEVNPAGSSASYAADWFELTNTGSSAIDITGWKMDDNSNALASAVALNGITSVGAGQSVIFLETATPAATKTAFLNAWFGPTDRCAGSVKFFGASIPPARRRIEPNEAVVAVGAGQDETSRGVLQDPCKQCYATERA